jgi:hypothetical protein
LNTDVYSRASPKNPIAVSIGRLHMQIIAFEFDLEDICGQLEAPWLY